MLDFREAVRAAAPAAPARASIQSTGLFGGLLDRFTEIVGDGPSYATFHLASQQEGMRLAEGAGPDDLGQLLDRADAILGQHSHLVAASPDLVKVDVTQSGLVGSSHVAAGVLLGLLEGLLRVVYKHPFEGAIESQTPGGNAKLAFRGKTA